MPRTSKPGKWGILESPEFSAVQLLIHDVQTHESDEARWLAVYKKLARESEDPLTALAHLHFSM